LATLIDVGSASVTDVGSASVAGVGSASVADVGSASVTDAGSENEACGAMEMVTLIYACNKDGFLEKGK
jgi:hypothetical protein